MHFTDFKTIESFKPDTVVLNTIVDCLDESHVDPVPHILSVLIRKYTYIRITKGDSMTLRFHMRPITSAQGLCDREFKVTKIGKSLRGEIRPIIRVPD